MTADEFSSLIDAINLERTNRGGPVLSDQEVQAFESDLMPVRHVCISRVEQTNDVLHISLSGFRSIDGGPEQFFIMEAGCQLNHANPVSYTVRPLTPTHQAMLSGTLSAQRANDAVDTARALRVARLSALQGQLPNPPPSSGPPTFLSISLKHPAHEWLKQVALAPRDPASRALILAHTHVYPPEDYTPESLDQILEAYSLANPPVQAAPPDELMDFLNGQIEISQRVRAGQPAAMNLEEVPGISLTRTVRYHARVEDDETCEVSILPSVVMECVEQARQGATTRLQFLDRLRDAIEEHYHTPPDGWHSTGDQTIDATPGTTTIETTGTSVYDPSEFYRWAFEQCAGYETDHDLDPLEDDLNDPPF